jgi:hypothetical protein
MNLQLNREPVVIDQSLVVGDFLFATHRDRALYLGKSARDRSHWLKENAGRWRRIQDVQQEAAPLGPPVESEINVGAVPAGPNAQTLSRDVRNDGDDEDDAGLVDILAGDCSSPHEPTSLPTPVTAIIKKRTTNTLTIGLAPSVVRPPGSATRRHLIQISTHGTMRACPRSSIRRPQSQRAFRARSC